MPPTAEEKSRALAEEVREKQWRGASFIRDLFLGRYRLDLLESFPVGEPARAEFWTFYEALERFLQARVDPAKIDARGEYPPDVIRGLADLGAFGMKIPTDYGGLGLSHLEYVRAIELLGSYDGNVTALLSAHQAIGVPQPIKLFGTEEQKRRFLPRLARGAISAFALTEPAVGSDPARLGTVAEPSEDRSHFVLNGEKLWCTNGTLAELIVVMARNPQTDRINAFVVETSWPGVRVEHRCRFMGLRALANAVIGFRDVVVPRDHMIGGEGDGLKIALITLNTGRLSLPASTAGTAKKCLEIARKWSAARVQWGHPIGKHEAIAHQLAYLAATAFAMESTAHLVGVLADREGYDIRLEAAAAKEWNTAACWRVVDRCLQIRGGRGYETEQSLAARGEAAIGVERALRDARINLIFEGSSEIMHLFMAREAVDKHLKIAGRLVDPDASRAARIAALPRVAGHYLWWYPSRWLGWSLWPRYSGYGRLAKHLRFAERSSRRLARSLFHGMVAFRGGLARRQAFLFRLVDIAMELFVLTASVSRARSLRAAGAPESDSAVELADLFARAARRRVKDLFRDLWRNDDSRNYRAGRELIDGRHLWLENGIVGLEYDEADLVPPSMDEILAARTDEEAKEPSRPMTR